MWKVSEEEIDTENIEKRVMESMGCKNASMLSAG